MKILVTDDSRVMRQIVIRTLRQAGYDDHDIVEAEDGADALAKVSSENPDLVLSDWNMPNMSGIECLEALRSSGSAVPFGFVTSEGSAEMREKAANAGALFLIAKPFTEDIFRGVLCLFLLDLGLVAARRLRDLKRSGAFLVAFAILLPLANAAIAIGFAKLIGAGRGDALLLAVLCGSASYIAVPAAIRLVIPEANPSLYVTSALALTFPFNITIGIPLYYGVIAVLGGVS